MAKFIAIDEVAITNMSSWNAEKPPAPLAAAWVSFVSFGAFFAGIMLNQNQMIYEEMLQIQHSR